MGVVAAMVVVVAGTREAAVEEEEGASAAGVVAGTLRSSTRGRNRNGRSGERERRRLLGCFHCFKRVELAVQQQLLWLSDCATRRIFAAVSESNSSSNVILVQYKAHW